MAQFGQVRWHSTGAGRAQRASDRTRLKVSEKGALSLYGIRRFIAEHPAELKRKRA